ncbi:MAG: CBS domain-containing protein, partial [Dokdonella sp.]
MHEEGSLLDELRDMDAEAAARRLTALPDLHIAQLLNDLGPGRALAILDRFGPERRMRIGSAAGEDTGDQWEAAGAWPEGTVGRLMEPAPESFTAQTRVVDALERLRPLAARTLVTYVFAIDEGGRLVGVVTFREMLFAQPEQRLEEIMVARPFALHPETDVITAMREVVRRHYPVYPVCDAENRLIGVVRGAV